ncbi:MAG: penicillin-binding protein 2 [Candidatus Zixiibacteriota bacterium]|nr:MAG: penicillin-binding protein 2 [candidate division Zixibacteria bacterium]
MAEYNNHIRFRLLSILAVLMLLALWVRLVELQVVHTSEYQKKSEANAIRVVEELPGRGVIVDRRGRVIVENRPSYSLTVIPSEVRKSRPTLQELAIILNRPEETILEELPARSAEVYRPYKLGRDIDFATLAALKARSLDLVGVNHQSEPKRYYPLSVAPHALGYIGEISEREKKRFPNRKTGDIVGKQGVERRYEDLLAGQKGYRYQLVNAYGQIIDELIEEYTPPQSSGKLYLTLDLELQYLAELLLEGRRGALVAMDPRDGGILALASTPKFDPEVFAGVLRASDWQALQNDPGVPLLNRATQSGYPPASTFKMMVLTAGIEEGIVTPDYRAHCSGGYYLGRVFHCFKREGHGTIDPLQSIESSCDVFYYQLGHRLGAERLGKYMHEFGFGEKTGIDIENEITGIAPDKKFFDKRFGVGKWSPALVLNVSIGQGEVLATPLQLARYCGILATSGLKATPHLFWKMHQKDTGLIEYQPQLQRINIKPSTFAYVREGMRRVVEGSGGTGRRFKDPRWQLAGKTGTAQNPHGDDHSLFIGFAPVEDPIIAVACVVENGGFGSMVAAPIAMTVIKRYLEVELRPDSLSQMPDSLYQKLVAARLAPASKAPAVKPPKSAAPQQLAADKPKPVNPEPPADANLAD